MGRLDRWLSELGLDRYAERLVENAIDLDILFDLTDEDLEKLGIPLGDRKRLLKAAGNLKATASARAPLAPPVADAERRQLTVMFCDLVGSTLLSTALDPEDYLEIIRAYREACSRVVSNHRGYVARYVGDGILVYFGYPQAHENDAECAVRTGLRVVDAVASLKPQPELRLKARVGIATGLVVAGDIVGPGTSEKGAVVGETPNLAARLQELAKPNSVVISDATRNLTRGLFECVDLGSHAIKGIAEPARAWQPVAELATESRFEAIRSAKLTAFVGRQDEIALLLDRWEQAKRGRGQAVLLSGEAGIGKSRITRFVSEHIAGELRTKLHYQCLSHRANSALYPIIHQLELAADFKSNDPPERKLQKLEALLVQSMGKDPKVASLFAALLSIPAGDRYPRLEFSPEQQKEKTLEAITDHLASRSAQQPVLFILEDAHWTDPTTEELIGMILDRLQKLPALVVITFRPEFTVPWGRRANLVQHTIQRLEPALCAEMVTSVSDCKHLPAEVQEHIVAKADGVPLYVEELTKLILESGLLKEEGDRYVLTGPLAQLAVPATLRDSLMARLDKLALLKEVAQVGSAIGRQFSFDMISAVARMQESQLQDGLRRLVELGLAFCSGEPPASIYTFKHALVQDTAHESMLRSSRRQLHDRIAEVLEQKFPQASKTSPEVIAYHYTEAAKTEKAIGYWLEAGRRSSERSANVESVRHLERGLDLVRTLSSTPENLVQELALLIALGPPLIATKGPSTLEVEQTYARAVELCSQLPHAALHFAALWGWWRIAKSFVIMRERADDLLVLADKLQDPELQLQAHHCQWATRFNLGELEECYEHISRGLKLYDERRDRSHASTYGGHDPRICAHGEAALAMWLFGYPGQAMAEIRKALSHARKLDHLGSQAHVMDIALMLHRYRRDAAEVSKQATDMIRFGEDHGLPEYEAKGKIFRGWALATHGTEPRGIEIMTQEITTLRAISTKEDFPVYFDMLAEACEYVGSAEEGLAHIDDAFAEARRSALLYWEAELYRRKGVLLNSIPTQDKSDVEICFRKAMDIASRQKAKSLELRAATSFAQLKRDQGEFNKAREMLEPIYNWFSECHQTVDLQEAEATLKELQ
ncbi:MAG: adenylate/guanylate cyclase domain-containing protein [Hyphomicrobium sp.]